MRDNRSQIWISPFQTKLFIRVGVYWLIYTITLFNFLFIWRLIQEGPGDIWDQFSRTVLDNLPLFLSFVVIAPWIALDSVRFASHLVGPLYRFQVTMKKITGGEQVPLIRLREGDFLLDMQDNFNDMIKALESRGALQIAPGRNQTANIQESGSH